MAKFKASDGARIFIFDESAISSTAADILSRAGFAATAFTDGMDALKAACSANPDLLIADSVMAPFSGIDLALLFRERQLRSKVLLFSGLQESDAPLQAARGVGLEFEVISKPVDPRELVKKVLEMTAEITRIVAQDRARQTYDDNVQERLFQLRENSMFRFPR
jgi:DNA-binding response OmpR family regulator